MAKYSLVHISYFCFIFSAILGSICVASAGDNDEERRVYIVYMGSLVEGTYEPTSIHHKMLQQVIGQKYVVDVLTRSYRRSFNGFAAKLTGQEAKKMSRMEGVVSIFPSTTLHLQTTRSWDFLGLTTTAKRIPAVESDIIIGMIDTGIWPESESFSDKGFGPPPKKWKGACAGGKNFTCNNKVIGARDYTNSSPRDIEGHGSHTTSIAAGNFVDGASFFGVAKGIARGGVPSARIAVYRVCTLFGCLSDGILAAFDDAIADGVDILSVSLGYDKPFDFKGDVLAIAAFHAMTKGILTVNSAGNYGNGGIGSTFSVSPWMLSVAASSSDRQFIDKILLGNGKTLTGVSINSFSLNGTKFPLVHGKDISREDCGVGVKSECSCLDETKVKGNILLCDNFEATIYRTEVVDLAVGFVGPIPHGVNTTSKPDIVPLPATALSNDSYVDLQFYQNSTKNPVAEILTSETIKDSTAPVVAFFSSLGPNGIVPDILKPDLTAPGINILAAYSPARSLEIRTDKRHTLYNILSGTSMSCPHVSGVAAYVKTFHPDWSPSAIKSALMTTASPMNPKLHSFAEFSYGSGQVNPLKATDPGLVYEASVADYVTLLCSVYNSSSEFVRQITGDNNTTCPESSKNVPSRNFNYPSLTYQVSSNQSFEISFSRTVTNVGNANSTYKAEISNNSKLNITVAPAVLSFKTAKENLSFEVTVSGALEDVKFVSAGLTWSDGVHEVRSPIVIYKQ